MSTEEKPFVPEPTPFEKAADRIYSQPPSPSKSKSPPDTIFVGGTGKSEETSSPEEIEYELSLGLEDKLFRESAYKPDGEYASTFRQMQTFADQSGTPESTETMFRESADFFRDYQYTDKEAEEFTRLVAERLKTPVTEEVSKMEMGESHRRLRETYGNDFGRHVKQVQTYVRKNLPGLARILEATGLGNHPEVVTTIMQKFNSMKGSGRLVAKKKKYTHGQIRT